MRKITILLAFVFISGIVYPQTNTKKEAAVQISFIPPMSTQGSYSAEYSNAFSFNILAGISKNENGFTFGGLTNIVKDSTKGLQFAGLCNSVGNQGKGVLFSGLLNTVRNDYKGVQFAGLTNMSGSTNGLQFAGLANISKNVEGFQFAGLINIAHNVSGVQLAGLINIAENSDIPIGFLNIIKNGEYGISLTYNEVGSTIVSLRSGGKYTYGIIGLGYNHKIKRNGMITEGGIGAHTNIMKWFRLNHEIKFESIGNFSDYFILKGGYSLIPAFRITKHIELFGGPAINYMITNKPENIEMFPKKSIWNKSVGTNYHQVYIGYQCGIQYIF